MNSYILAAVLAVSFATPAFAEGHMRTGSGMSMPASSTTDGRDCCAGAGGQKAAADRSGSFGAAASTVSAYVGDVGTENPYEVYRPRPLREGLSD
jgi:hypothetical protein